MLNILVFALLFALMWNFKKKPHGLSLAGYLLGYGVVRSIMEPLRDAQFILGDKVQASWVMAVIMAVAGAMLAACVLVWNYKKYGRLFGAADPAQALAVLPVYYTKEDRRKMEEEARKKRLAAPSSPALAPPQPPADAERGTPLAEEEFIPNAEGERAAGEGDPPAGGKEKED